MNEYNIVDIFNAFHHLLTAHDSERDFAIIHAKLNQ